MSIKRWSFILSVACAFLLRGTSALTQVPSPPQALSDALWSGRVQCQLTSRPDGYTHQETQTWTLTGAPIKMPGAIDVYPANWTVSGQGTTHRTLNAQVLSGAWKTSVAPTNATIAISVRASDKRLVIKPYHSPLVAPGGTIGTRQTSVVGAAPAQSSLVFPVSEWVFPAIEADANSNNVSGSGTIAVSANQLPLHPAGGSEIASCTWQFVRATQSASQPQAQQGSALPRPTSGASSVPNAPAMTNNQPTPPQAVTSDSTSPHAITAGPPAQTLTQAPANSPLASQFAPPSAPSGFTAKDFGSGAVQFTWQAVNGVAKYRLEGTGIPSSGVYVSSPATNATVQKIPPGPGTWHLASVSAGDVASTAEATVSAVIRYAPAHSAPWLTKNNGVGSASLAQSHFMAACTACIPGATFGAVAIALGLPSTLVNAQCAYGSNCGSKLVYSDDFGGQWSMEAIYSNVTEFGTTRSAACWMGLTVPPGSQGLPPRVLCYSNSGNHGLTVIAKDMQYTWFLTFTSSDPNASIFNYKLTTDVTFDSEGAKHAPHACLACHGGQFSGGRVTGSTLLPLDPGVIQITDSSNHMGLNVLGVNQAVMAANPSAAVSRYVVGLYGRDPRQVALQSPAGDGTSFWTDLSGGPFRGSPWANLDYVPSGWQQRASVYKSTIKPYCVMCHLATPPNLDFTTPNNFNQNKDLVYNAVCASHSMPHAEYPYKTFWTKDTGQVFTPGVLVGLLGKSCP